MMETITLQVFTFDELNEGAKERACCDYRTRMDHWADESLASVDTFCGAFNVSLTHWSVDAWQYEFCTNAKNENFRGMKLRDFKRDHMPTGYCLDCALWQTFFDVFKKTGDAKGAFNDALHAGFAAWRDDMEWQESAECIGEVLQDNGWQFFADGRAYWGE